jgi:hypothetical protein
MGQSPLLNFRGGNLGHINTSNRDWLGAALHDILHFAAFKDGYLSKGSGDSRTFDGYLSGYSSDNIMSARDGTVISQSEIEDADDYGRGQKTNRICHYEATDDHHHALVCGF